MKDKIHACKIKIKAVSVTRKINKRFVPHKQKPVLHVVSLFNSYQEIHKY